MTISIRTAEGRQVAASMGQLCAYFEAMDTSDWALASAALSFFQREWVGVGEAIMAQLPAAIASRWTTAGVIPSSLSASGIWDEPTRNVSRAVILLVFGSETYNAISTSVPTTAGRVGPWFRGTLEPYLASLPEDVVEIIDSFGDEAREGGVAHVAEDFAARTAEVLDGRPSTATPELVRPPVRAPSIQEAVAARVGSEASPIALPGITLPARRSSTRSAWVYLAWAVGIGTVGLTSFWLWSYQRTHSGRMPWQRSR